jgi:uncharacterized protein (DUF927 family)
MKAFCEQYVPAGADGQVERVAQRFALIAVGGEMAQQQGILPWEAGVAIKAAAKCFEDWLNVRGGHGATEIRDGLEQVRSFLNANGMARFIPAWAVKENTILPRDACGYRQRVSGDGWDYYITGTAWREEVCRGIDARRLATAMVQRGYIDAGDKTHIGKEVRVPGYGKQRFYHVLSTLLEDGEDA